jgi:hypothetical protein
MADPLDLLADVMFALDTPGAMVRTAIGGGDPIAAITSEEDRIYGRELLRILGIAGPEDTWGSFAAGVGTEIALDPLNLLAGLGAASKFRHAAKVGKANKAAKAAHQTAQEASEAAVKRGFMPSEAAAATVLKDEAGQPLRLYSGHPDVAAHGRILPTGEDFTTGLLPGARTTSQMTTNAELAGRGAAGVAPAPHLADEFARLPAAARLEHFADVRKPFDTGAYYAVDDLPPAWREAGEDIVSPTHMAANFTRQQTPEQIQEALRRARWELGEVPDEFALYREGFAEYHPSSANQLGLDMSHPRSLDVAADLLEETGQTQAAKAARGHSEQIAGREAQRVQDLTDEIARLQAELPASAKAAQTPGGRYVSGEEMFQWLDEGHPVTMYPGEAAENLIRESGQFDAIINRHLGEAGRGGRQNFELTLLDSLRQGHAPFIAPPAPPPLALQRVPRRARPLLGLAGYNVAQTAGRR